MPLKGAVSDFVVCPHPQLSQVLCGNSGPILGAIYSWDFLWATKEISTPSKSNPFSGRGMEKVVSPGNSYSLAEDSPPGLVKHVLLLIVQLTPEAIPF